MHQLQLENRQLFLDGKFSVKKTRKQFCWVSVDQASIVGISKHNAERGKRRLTYNEKLWLAEGVYKMYGIYVDKDVDEEWYQH